MPVIPQTIQVRHEWSYGGTPWAYNVLHYIVPGGFDVNADTTDLIAQDVGVEFQDVSALRTHIKDGVTLSGVSVRDLRTPNEPEWETPLLVPGTRTGAAAPLQLSSVVTLRTAKAGKSFRGRVYLGGFAVAAIGPNGEIDTPVRAACVSWIESQMTKVIDGSLLVLGVASRLLLETNQVLTAVSRDDTWDWQRSRATVG